MTLQERSRLGAASQAQRAAERERIDALWRAIYNETLRERRRQLYRDDPLWRLSKLKDNRERRLRAKVAR